MGIKIIYQDSDFIMYEPETYEEYEFICGSFYLVDKSFTQWKQEYKYIYVIKNISNNDLYLYVPDNDTFKLKHFETGSVTDENIIDFQEKNPLIGNFIEDITYTVLKRLLNCVVKKEKLTTELKTYIIVNDSSKSYIYTSMSEVMNRKLINFFKQNLDLVAQISNYISQTVLNQIYN